MKMIDLATPIEDGLEVDLPQQRARIEYKDHQTSLPEMLACFPGVIADQLTGKCGWAVEQISLSTHTGPHLDAPWHYDPVMNGGEKAWTIDQIPLEWCIGDGVMVDFSHKPDGYVCTSEDFKAYFQKVGYTLKAGDIVLIHTSAPEAWGRMEYMKRGCGIGREATLWLCGQGVHITGTDAWSWDAPLPLEAEEFAKDGDPSIIWQGHKAGREAIYCHMEKLCNLDQLPPFGFRVIALPIKITGASAGWVRPVALL